MHYEQNYNLLAIRPGEEWKLTRERPLTTQDYERVYIVAIVTTPPFPFAEEQTVHEECRQQAVIAAEVYPTIKSGMQPRIGWVILDPDAKYIVGKALEIQQAQPGEWFYMTLDARKFRNDI